MDAAPDKVKGTKKGSGNKAVAIACLSFVVAMIGVSFAAVPLYRMFCQATGYGGTTQRVEQVSDRILDKTITVRFDANTSPALNWKFEPEQREVTLRIGETAQVAYRATNYAHNATRGRAAFNVTPEQAGAYFNKLQCFCFNDQTLKSGETLEMPIVFYIDPDIVDVPELKGVNTITLSYTFFPVSGDKPVAETSTEVPAQTRKLGG